MTEPTVLPDKLRTLDTKGHGGVDEAVISDAMSRISEHDPAQLNAVAGAVSDVLGFTLLSRRYSIAILALEALKQAPMGFDTSGEGQQK